MRDPIWTSGASKRARQERRLQKRIDRANFRVRYDLAYDGGGSVFDEYYKTRTGARISAFFHLHFRSWGGSADLYPHPMPEPIRHLKRHMTMLELIRKQLKK